MQQIDETRGLKTPTARELLAACFLRAYYDGKHDAALSRLGRGPSGLDNLPDDQDVERLMFEREDEEGERMRARALALADNWIASGIK